MKKLLVIILILISTQSQVVHSGDGEWAIAGKIMGAIQVMNILDGLASPAPARQHQHNCRQVYDDMGRPIHGGICCNFTTVTETVIGRTVRIDVCTGNTIITETVKRITIKRREY